MSAVTDANGNYQLTLYTADYKTTMGGQVLDRAGNPAPNVTVTVIPT